MTAAAPHVEILAAGTELLTGEVRDSDVRFLAAAATFLGAVVTRAVILPDEPAVLEAAIRESLGRAPRLLFTCGGLGPTEDDRTLAAVAAAAGVPLEEDASARAMVERRYADLAARGAVGAAALTAERLKMALLPRGASPVENPVGAAPGVVLARGATTVISLPGVPPELEAIVEGPLAPTLASLLAGAAYAAEDVIVRTGDESVLAPAVAEAARAFPSVRVKSRARRFGPEVRMAVTLAARGADAAEAKGLVSGARAALLAACAARGLSIA